MRVAKAEEALNVGRRADDGRDDEDQRMPDVEHWAGRTGAAMRCDSSRCEGGAQRRTRGATVRESLGLGMKLEAKAEEAINVERTTDAMIGEQRLPDVEHRTGRRGKGMRL